MPFQRLRPPNENTGATTGNGKTKLMVLSAHGPVDDTASLISTSRLQQLFNDLRQRYDFIVLNAPSTHAVRDATDISEIADPALMVGDWGKTTVDQERPALELLAQDIDGGTIK